MQTDPSPTSSVPALAPLDPIGDMPSPSTSVDLLPISRATRRFFENIVALVILIVGFNALFVIVQVQDFTMSPLLPPGHTVVTSCASYWLVSPQRGEIATVNDTSNNTLMLRRVIGLPGDRVVLTSGQVLVNGEVLNEPYATADFNANNTEFFLKPDEYFVLADNRNLATRMVGVVPAKQIVARAWFILWPFEYLGKISAPKT
ncbi:MAG: signal peptidase I [Anaerolineae bacterium]|nr:signal peptidase I [Anaerolineae bacterium]